MLVGIVGKPNVGKSTFFKASTLANVEIANHPFVTIKPNRGVGFVRVQCADVDLNTQCNPREGFCMSHQRFIPVELLDVAGLVPGASEGKGMGNQFLNDLSQADALIHVIDASGGTNEMGEPIEVGTYDPAYDIKFLETELDMWYLQLLNKSWDKMSKLAKIESLPPYKAITKQFLGLKINEGMIKDLIAKLNLDANDAGKWSELQIKEFAIKLRVTTKKMIIAANKCDMPTSKENIEKLRKEFPNYRIVPCAADFELALKEASKKQMISYIPGDASFEILDKSKLNEIQLKALDKIANTIKEFNGSGVQQTLNEAVFSLLGYIAIFPGGLNNLKDQYGRIMPDCFLLPPNSTALDFAFKIHTDLGQHFIRAINVKKRLTVGKEYALQNRDVIEIISDK